MNEYQLLQRGFRSWLISLAGIALAIGAMTASTAHVYLEDPDCEGMMGAGFPTLFICDVRAGSSPTGSLAKIDFADVLNGGILPGGFFIDFLFYFTVMWIFWFATSNILSKGMHRSTLWWTTFISIGVITGFFLAFLIFLPEYTKSARSIQIRTPTAVSTMPPQTEIATPAVTETPSAGRAIVPAMHYFRQTFTLSTIRSSRNSPHTSFKRG